jgi:hypothetical protein
MNIKNKILSTNGRFFSVKFIKADGSTRKMVARIGVKKHLRGGESTVSHKDYLLTVFDVQKKAYRNINLDKVFEFNREKVLTKQKQLTN